MTRAVVIRGAGAVCAAGHGIAAILAAQRPQSTSAAPRLAPFDPARDLPGGHGRRLGRQPALALAAILEALGGAREPEGTPLLLSTAHGAMFESIEFVASVVRWGAAGASPLLFAQSLHNTMAGAAGRALGLRGPAIVVTDGDASFEAALVVAVSMLRNGRADRVIVAGSDASHALFEEGLRAVGGAPAADARVDPESGATARGFPPAEGAGALVLEAADDGAPGVRIERAAIGDLGARPPGRVAGVRFLGTGDARSNRAHAVAWSAFEGGGVASPEPTFPGALYGAFGSLSAVAIATEAGRRLASDVDDAATAFLHVPKAAKAAIGMRRSAPAALVVLTGRGKA